MSLWDASSARSANSSQSNSFSQTFGTAATQSSNEQAALANNTALEASREAQRFNAEQAQIQREWQERMANTVYQRSVSDMRKAGINPILAANMGLGTGSVGSGAAASISNPSTFMGQSFTDQQSASHSESSGYSTSESGLATFLTSMQAWVEGMIGALNSSKTIDVAINGLESVFGNPDKNKDGDVLDDSFNSLKDVINGKKSVNNFIKEELSPLNSPFFGQIRKNKYLAENPPKANFK